MVTCSPGSRRIPDFRASLQDRPFPTRCPGETRGSISLCRCSVGPAQPEDQPQERGCSGILPGHRPCNPRLNVLLKAVHATSRQPATPRICSELGLPQLQLLQASRIGASKGWVGGPVIATADKYAFLTRTARTLQNFSPEATCDAVAGIHR